MAEYNNIGVGQACSYTTLASYNGARQGAVSAPRLSGVSRLINPSFNAAPVGYNSLANAAGSCSGYSSLQLAYAGPMPATEQYTGGQSNARRRR